MKGIQQVISSLAGMADRGVKYSSRRGAVCPCCRERAKVYATRRWEGVTRVRYHRCHNKRCALSSMGVTIKSIEEDKEAKQ